MGRFKVGEKVMVVGNSPWLYDGGGYHYLELFTPAVVVGVCTYTETPIVIGIWREDRSQIEQYVPARYLRPLLR